MTATLWTVPMDGVAKVISAKPVTACLKNSFVLNVGLEGHGNKVAQFKDCEQSFSNILGCGTEWCGGVAKQQDSVVNDASACKKCEAGYILGGDVRFIYPYNERTISNL